MHSIEVCCRQKGLSGLRAARMLCFAPLGHSSEPEERGIVRVCVCSTLSLPMTGGILTGSAVVVTSHKSAISWPQIWQLASCPLLFSLIFPLFSPLSLGSVFHLVSWGLGIHKMSNVLYQVCTKKTNKQQFLLNVSSHAIHSKNTGVCLLNYGRAERWLCLVFVHWFSTFYCGKQSQHFSFTAHIVYIKHIQYIHETKRVWVTTCIHHIIIQVVLLIFIIKY